MGGLTSMTDLTLIKKGAGLAGLDDEIALLEALVAIAKNWEKLAGELDTPANALALLDKVIADLGTDSVKNAFAKLHLDGAYADLTRLAGKVKDFADKIPPKLKTLLKALSEFGDADAGAVEWGLDGSKEAELSSKVKLKVSGDAKLQFAAAAKATIGETKSSGLLQLGAHAGVSAEGSAKLPIQWGSFDASAGASAEVGLDYFYKPSDRKTIYGIALADRILNLPDPFDYDSIWNAFQSARELEGITYLFKDKANVKADLVLSASGNLLDDVLGEVKLAVGASASISNAFVMSLRAVPAPDGAAGKHVEIILSRTTDSSAGISLGIDVKLDGSALLGQVREVLNKAVARSEKTLGKITPYLTPGTWLREKAGAEIEALAGKLIKDPALKGLRDALVVDIKALFGDKEPDETAILKWLSDKVTGAVDDGAKDLTGAADALLDKLVARVSDALPVPADLKATFTDKAKTGLASLVARVNKAFRDELTALIGPSDKAIRKAFKAVGIKLDKNLDAIDKLFEPIRKLIDEYNRVLKLAKEFADDSGRAKIAASLKVEELWKWGLEEKLIGTFTGPEAAGTFNKLATGDVADFKALLRDDKTVPGFKLDARSHLKRTARRTTKQDFSLVAFGFSESGSLLLDGNAELLIDGNGDVQVDARAELKKRFKTKTEEREVNFVDTFSLKLTKAADGTPQATRTIEVGVGIAHVDKELQTRELNGFIQSLANAGLVSDDTPAVATKQYGLWAPDGKAIAADISAKLQLTPEQIRRLMHIGPGDRDKNGRLTDAVKKRLISTAVAAGDEVGKAGKTLGEYRVNILHGARTAAGSHQWDMNSLSQFLYDRVWDASQDQDLDVRRSYQDLRPGATTGDIAMMLGEYQRMLALIGIVQRLGDIYLAVPKVGDAEIGWDEMKYAEEEHALAGECSWWLQTGGGGFQISDALAAVTITFLATICDLVGINRKDPKTDAVTVSLAGTPPGAAKRVEVPLI